MASDSWNLCSGNVIQRICASCILGYLHIRVVNRSWIVLSKHDVLEHRAELDGAEDLWLLLFGQVDALGVASSLDVEDASVCPAVFVVSEQCSVRVCRQSRFAGSGQAEEDRDVALLAFVCACVHREDSSVRHVVVHDTEEPFLHFTCVLRSENGHFSFLEIVSQHLNIIETNTFNIKYFINISTY